MDNEELKYNLLSENAAKLEFSCKQFERFWIYQCLFFILGMGTLLGTFNGKDINSIIRFILPEDVLGVNRDALEYIIPIIMIYAIFKFGMISLKMFGFFVQRDLLIFDFVQFSTDERKKNKKELEKLMQLKGVFRTESFGGLFYRTMVFKGIEIDEYKEEVNHRYKYPVYVVVNGIFYSNVVLIVAYTVAKFVSGDIIFVMILSVLDVVIVISLISFFPKLKELRRRIKKPYKELRKRY